MGASLVAAVSTAAAPELRVIRNWPAELKGGGVTVTPIAERLIAALADRYRIERSDRVRFS